MTSWDTDSIIYSPSTSSIYSDYLWQSEEVYPNPDYTTLHPYRQPYYYCSCCNPLPADSYISDHQESSNFPFGHNLPQDYSDFRASSRAKQRDRKIRENKGGCNSYRCRKSGQAQQRTINQKKKKEAIKYATRESQKIEHCYTRNFSKRTKHHFITWDVQQDEEMDAWVHDMEDDVIRYITLHHGAEAFESPEPYVEFGESFSVWCQRRIAEMRAVKESRIRRGEPASRDPLVWRRKYDWRHVKRYDVYTGDETSTTLPTNAYDAAGHELLRAVLSPGRWYQKPQRVDNASLFRPINNYRWFGEFAWAWHRNESGCWEIGYDGGCSQVEGDWSDGPIPCPHCCAESPGMYYECFCRQCSCTPAPEEMQRCSLVEWVGTEGRKIMIQEVARETEIKDLDGDAKASECGSDCGWEVISVASSETWSVVDVA